VSVSRGTSGRGGTPSSARGAKNQPRRPNRSQARAIDARARSVIVPDATTELVVEDAAPAAAESAPRTPNRTGRRARPASRPIVLTREEEYRFIRSDLRRLLITSGVLLLLMMVLLVLIEL